MDKDYNKAEEITCAIISGIGGILSIAGMIIFIIKESNPLNITLSVLTFTSMIIYYISSTLYHALADNRGKQTFYYITKSFASLELTMIIDLISICFLKGVLGWIIFGISTTLGILAIIFASIPKQSFTKTWFILNCIVGINFLFILFPYIKITHSIAWILLSITITCAVLGTVFYSIKVKYFHIISHSTYLIGLISLFFILFYYFI